LLVQLSAREDARLTLGGRGDPLLHNEFEAIVKEAVLLGISCINVRTDLLCSTHTIDMLLELPIDIITVMLHADDRNTYFTATGVDRFKEVIGNLERLLNGRAKIAGSLGHLAKPIIVPAMIRCEQTINDVRNFYDRWTYYAGAVLIEEHSANTLESYSWDDHLIRIRTPDSARSRINANQMSVRADGHVLPSAAGWLDDNSLGSIHKYSIEYLWKKYMETSKKQPQYRASKYTLPPITTTERGSTADSLFSLQDNAN